MSAGSTDNLHERIRLRALAARAAAISVCNALRSFTFGMQAVNRDQDERLTRRHRGEAESDSAAAVRRFRGWCPFVTSCRDEVVLSAQTWVVKVGTSVLTGPDGTLDPARIGHLAEQISLVMDQGRKSGARELGRGRGRDGPAWLEAPAREPSPASGRGSGRTGVFDSCL